MASHEPRARALHAPPQGAPSRQLDDGDGKLRIQCPHCHTPSESIKVYTMLGFLLFLFVFAYHRRKTVVACPRCMRAAIFESTVINVLPANLLWVVLVLPWNAILFGMSFTRGHSRKVHGMMG